MKKLQSLAIAALAVLFLIPAQQVRAEEKGAEPLKIGYIDIQRALNESEAGRQARLDLENLVRSKRRIIDQKAKEKQELERNLEKQMPVLSEDARQLKIEEIRKLDKEIERMVTDSQEELQRKQQERERDILKELEKIINDVAESNDYDLIIPIDVVIYAEDGLEITDEVVDIYDRQRKEGMEKQAGEGTNK